MTMKLPGGLHQKIGVSAAPGGATNAIGGMRTLTAGAAPVTVATSATSDVDTTWTVESTTARPAGLSSNVNARHMVLLTITSGTPAAARVDYVIAGRRAVVVGTYVSVEAQIIRIDGLLAPDPAITVDVTCAVSRGITGEGDHSPSMWIQPPELLAQPQPNFGLQTGSGRFSTNPCVLKSFVAVNHGTTETTILIVNGDNSADPAASVFFTMIVPAGAFRAIEPPGGRVFPICGTWSVSSTRDHFTADTTTPLRIDVEIEPSTLLDALRI